MNKLLFIAALAIVTSNTYAQNNALALATDDEGTTAVTTSKATAANAPVFIDASNQWKYIEMKQTGDKIYFTHLDGLDALKVVITKSSGDEVMKLSVNKSTNAVDCKRLPAGLYFVTLINENNGQKRAFTLNK